MTTKIFTTKDDYLKTVCEVLNSGEVVALPTETVYGLCANALDEKAVVKIFEAKNRPCDNPLIVHIANKDDILNLVTELPEKAKKCIDAFWPGPFTVILNKKDIVPKVTSGGLNTVAVRMPQNEVITKVIKESGLYLAAPSANLSGRPSPTKADHVISDMSGKISAIVDGGECMVGLESTVVSFVGEHPRLLRPGFITAEQIKEICPDLVIDEGVTKSVADKTVLSPGMKYKHYAPKCNLTLVDGSSDMFCEYANKLNIPAVCFENDKNNLTCDFISLGENPEKNLFAVLRELDEKGYEKAIIHAPKKAGIGLALYNRMVRSCGFNEISLPFIVGLTGPSGTGKTTLTKKASEMGFFTIDCDKVAHEVVPTLKPQLIEAFGEDVFENGVLNRKKLADKAFINSEETQKLNNITLPAIVAKIKEIIKDSGSLFILLDGATIIESGINKECSVVISLLCDEAKRIERFKKRDNLTEEQAKRRAGARKPNEFYEKNSNYLLFNDDTVLKLCNEFENIINNTLKGE